MILRAMFYSGLFLASVVAQGLSGSRGPRTTTSKGAMNGEVLQSRNGRDYFSFSSIPYGQPPVGTLRFMPPVPARSWYGALDATRPLPPCFRTSEVPYYLPDAISDSGQEDCLYLSVYTPNLKKSAKLPVMFWIHGGGFANGYPGLANSSRYFLDQDVVLVTASYRLGTLGFLSFEDNILPGNMGLKDLELALLWTRNEIRNFGGNPNEITIFGQSAGGIATHLLCSVPRLTALVKGCISESGTGYAFWAIKQPGTARREANNLAAALGCSGAQLLSCLQSIPVERVTNLTLLQSTDFTEVSPVLESPTAPRSILTEWPTRSRRFNWITGISQDEGLLFTAYYEFNATPEERDQFIENFNASLVNFLHLDNTTDQIERINERFFVEGVEPLVAIRNAYSESAFVYPALKSLTEHTGSKYFYVFNYTGGPTLFAPDDGEPLPGATHSDELPYLFDSPFRNTPENFPTQQDTELSRTLINLWANFARTQSPNGEGQEKWTQFKDGNYLRIDNAGLRLDRINNYQEIINFWDPIFQN